MKTASLEVSRKLVEAGIAIDTEFSWNSCPAGIVVGMTSARWNEIPAPTACELGEVLPEICQYWTSTTYEPVEKVTRWVVFFIYRDPSNKLRSLNHRESADTEADSRGLMLIWLKENGHLNKGEK